MRNPRFNGGGRVIPADGAIEEDADSHAHHEVTTAATPTKTPTPTANPPASQVETAPNPITTTPRTPNIQDSRRNTIFHSVGNIRMAGKSSINVLRTSMDEIKEQAKYRWVLHPMSGWKTLWDLLSACIVIWYSWMIPFMLSFHWYVPPVGIVRFHRVLDVWGFLDIILRFRVGIVEYGTVIMNPALIRRSYVRSIWFPIDIASSTPFEYFVSDPTNGSTRNTVNMLKYVKLPRLLRIGRFLRYVKAYKRYSSMTIALNAIAFLAHVTGCLWVALLDPCGDENQTEEPMCAPGHEMDVYWIALHHGTVTLLGISADHVEDTDQLLSGGYKKAPGTAIASELYMWSTVISVLGTIATAALFGTVINLVQSWNRAENAFRKKMDQITYEMDALSLPKPIRARITAYHDYLWLNNRTFSEELNLLKDTGMSLVTRQQIAIYLFKDYLLKIPFFQLATDDVLGMICLQLRQVIYMPNDFVIHEGEIGKELFMIVKGIVQVMPAKKASLTTPAKILLGEGDFFGEIGVVMEVERTRSVKAECVAELCILSRDGFDKILVEFPEFAQAMKHLIIKRVSDMWQTDGRENIEKMTMLADYQMKKKVATYNNMQKLRHTAKAIQTFYPRLSKVVKDVVPSDLLGVDDETLATMRGGNAMPLQDNYSSRTSPHNGAGTICVADSEQHLNPLHPPPSRLPEINSIPEDSEVDEGAEGNNTERRQIPYRDGYYNEDSRMEKVEKQLHALENKLDQHMVEMDAKISRLLQALVAAPPTCNEGMGTAVHPERGGWLPSLQCAASKPFATSPSSSSPGH